MKKIVSVLMCLALACCIFSGCTKQESITNDIVLITDGRTVADGGYNQSAWEGIESYAEENDMTCRYYQPTLTDGELTLDVIEQYISLAAERGAKYIVLPGEDFAVSAYEVAPTYPDVNFILLDAVPHSQGDTTDRYVSNVMSVKFDALQSGFLAGYIAVLNGNTELGYFGEYSSDDSANYGAGFVQGAAYAADTLAIPVTLDWAEYDSPLLDYNYDFTVTACYEKIEDQTDTVFKVNIVNGTGSGTYTEGSNVTVTADPAPEGQVFDKWEVQSDTDGVKDKKVNISSKSSSSMNLLVEKCDCTITATYKDIEGDYCNVTVMTADGSEAYSTQSVSIDSSCDITAPVAEENMVFDHWETSAEDAVEDIYSSSTKVNVASDDITLTPVYVESSTPTFNVTVVTGEGGDGDSQGSGSYVTGDVVNISAALPEDGYMFSHWENTDSYSNSTGIAMDNEYYWSTSFEMVDRYASLCDQMYEHGVSLIFEGGNSMSASALTSKWNFDYDLSVMSAGENNSDAFSTIVKNYGEAIKDCLENFAGSSVTTANCSTEALYATFVSEDEELTSQYDAVYQALANGDITPTLVEGGAGYDFCKLFNESNASKCLTLNAWFIEGISLTTE